MCCLGRDTFKVKISPLDKKEHIRIHVPAPLDRGDGSFLVRYRLYGTVLTGLKVEVLHQDAAVAKSPYTIQGSCCHALRNTGTGSPFSFACQILNWTNKEDISGRVTKEVFLFHGRQTHHTLKGCGGRRTPMLHYTNGKLTLCKSNFKL